MRHLTPRIPPPARLTAIPEAMWLGPSRCDFAEPTGDGTKRAGTVKVVRP